MALFTHSVANINQRQKSNVNIQVWKMSCMDTHKYVQWVGMKSTLCIISGLEVYHQKSLFFPGFFFMIKLIKRAIFLTTLGVFILFFNTAFILIGEVDIKIPIYLNTIH